MNRGGDASLLGARLFLLRPTLGMVERGEFEDCNAGRKPVRSENVGKAMVSFARLAAESARRGSGPSRSNPGMKWQSRSMLLTTADRNPLEDPIG